MSDNSFAVSNTLIAVAKSSPLLSTFCRIMATTNGLAPGVGPSAVGPGLASGVTSYNTYALDGYGSITSNSNFYTRCGCHGAVY